MQVLDYRAGTGFDMRANRDVRWWLAKNGRTN
jgi:hypothetical protein